MRTPDELRQLKDRAIAMRRAGLSRRQIREALGPIGSDTLTRALQGEPPPGWTRRPRAKDNIRAQARELREMGLDYEQTAAELNVSKGSVSLWVRDMPIPPHLSVKESRKRSAEGVRRLWAAKRPIRDAARAGVISAASLEIGELSDREVLIAGAIAYWCEGSKSKPWRTDDQVAFTNSDPGLIRFFLRFLHTVGVEPNRLTYRVLIHENADARAAERFWSDVTRAELARFRKPTLKRHNPKTVRKNVGEDYHGCLVVRVLRSAELYQRIAGGAEGVMKACTDTAR